VFTLEKKKKKKITRVSLLFWLLPSDKLTTLAFYHSTFPYEFLRKKNLLDDSTQQETDKNQLLGIDNFVYLNQQATIRRKANKSKQWNFVDMNQQVVMKEKQ
jgi:hypothetical protein